MNAQLRGRCRGWLSVAFLSLLGLPSSAFAQSAGTDDARRECAAKHEQSQVLRNGGRLLESLAALRVCSQQSCQAAVREDCVQWFEEVKRSVPSVVVRARSGDVDQLDVRVSIDGRLASSRLDGQPIELDPGSHIFRFECAGFDPIEREVLVTPGEKLRTIPVEFAPPAEGAEASEAASPSGAPNQSGARTAAKPRSTVSPLAYVAAGTALLGAAGFAGFGLWGLDQRSSLESSCKPSCKSSEVNGVRTKFLVADISLGVSLVAAVTAGVIFFSKSSSPPKSEERKARAKSAPRLNATIASGTSSDGAWLGLKGAF
jgi:hypothetical protein